MNQETQHDTAGPRARPWKEVPCAIGEGRSLLGVATVPTAPSKKPLALLLSNAGLVHHVGPQDLFVEIARHFARLGVHGLRFDIGGLGDSIEAKGAAYETRAVGDTGAAMDFLGQQFGIDRFVILGICSGADDAHRSAVADPRVVGVVQIDGYAYRNAGFYARHYGGRLLERGASRKVARKLISRLRPRERDATAPEAHEALNYRTFPSREQFSEDLARLAERAVKQLFVFTRSWREQYGYREQMVDTFGKTLCRDVTVEMFPDSDHVFQLLDQRQGLIHTVESWFTRELGS